MQRTPNHYVIIGRNEQGSVAQWVFATADAIDADRIRDSVKSDLRRG